MPCTNWESIWLCVTGRENTQGRSVSLSQVKDQRQAGWGCLAALLPQIPREPPEGSVKPGPFPRSPSWSCSSGRHSCIASIRKKERTKTGGQRAPWLSSRKIPDIALYPSPYMSLPGLHRVATPICKGDWTAALTPGGPVCLKQTVRSLLIVEEKRWE